MSEPGIRFILGSRQADGSWGTAGYALVPTLGAATALLAYHERTAVEDAEVRRRALLAGLRWLTDAFTSESAELDLPDTVASEILVPSLVESIRRQRESPSDREVADAVDAFLAASDRRQVGEQEKFAVLRSYVSEGAELPKKVWHIIEALEPIGPAAARRITPDGGVVGCSPAATALWQKEAESDDLHVTNYLGEVDKAIDSGVPMGASMRYFEMLWVLIFAARAGFAAEVPESLLDEIDREYDRETGIGGGDGLPTDADDTSFAIIATHGTHRALPLEPLLRFWTGTHFRTYSYERTYSETTNAHALECLSLMSATMSDDRIGDIGRSARRWLVEKQHTDGYWFDKWCISPYYATGECVRAIVAAMTFGSDPESDIALLTAIEWMLSTQKPDGSWGMGQEGTAEETAYAVLALDVFLRSLSSDSVYVTKVRSAIQRSTEHLVAEPSSDFPALWMGKDLYAPRRVIRAAILAGIAVADRYARMEARSA
ncbi:prenyltransferase/squalene oxidase repeat-containing protein [Nocardia arizonensis]|uniref:prenyltransferase/squalene oxidase repeat-containing protein n=1 Tax=Nocardia arizonensis TaxID=1141647 RepID=UPI00138F8341|nr:prenyltransferase/squalene oxidase repeat-containing protein [Nocardia arizonensis]